MSILSDGMLMDRRVGFCIVFAFVLAACEAGVTRTPGMISSSPTLVPPSPTYTQSPTSIPSPSPTTRPSATPSPSPLPPGPTSTPQQTPILATQTATPSPTSPPQTPLAGPGGYQLVALTEADYRQMLADVDMLIPDDNWQTWDSPYDDLIDYQIALEREAWLRFPDPAAEWASVAWDIARREIPYGGDQIQSSEYRFESLLREALNLGQTTPDQMGEWLEARGFTLANMLPAENLMGDGQPGWVLEIYITKSARDMRAVFALVALANGEYRLAQVYPWTSFFHGRLRFEVVESTAIGLPGILLMDHFFGSGFATWEHDHLYLMAWQDSAQRFVNLAQDIPILEMDEFIHVISRLDPPNWEVGPLDDQGTQAITSTVEFYTPPECPHPTYQTVYRWDGQQYQWAGEGFTDVGPAASRLCQVMWALITGRADSQTIAILNAALEDGSGNYDQYWGPAWRDYLRLQLGFLYALSGQRQAALLELQAVRDQPEHPEFHMASDLARIFLRAYPSVEAFQACNAVVNYLTDAMYAQATFGDVFGQLFPSSILPLWGITDPRWIWDGSSVCNVDAALQQSLQSANPQNTNQLVEWLNGSRIGWGPLARADLDGNGVEDWLVTIQRVPGPVGSRWEVWVFLRDGQNIRSIPVLFIGHDTPSITFQLLYPNPQERPVGFLFVGSYVTVFEFRPAVSDLPFVSDLPAKPVSLIDEWLFYGFDAFEISDDGQTLSLYDQGYTGYYSPFDTMQAVLHWETYAESYVVTERLPSPQEQAIQAVERAIFMNNRPEEAILPLQELLAGEIFEDREWSSEEGFHIGPPGKRIYLTYLLGLAYELSGDEANALQTYWHLWHDYPDSPYAILASRKLLLLQPGG